LKNISISSPEEIFILVSKRHANAVQMFSLSKNFTMTQRTQHGPQQPS